MAEPRTTWARPDAEDIRQVPAEASLRAALRAQAARLAPRLDPRRPPTREQLEALAAEVLSALDAPPAYLGFAMVALSNAFWEEQFLAVPPARRLLLLPHCLRDPAACRGRYDSVGLHCAACGACELGDLRAQAESLGYQVLIAEGTSSVLLKVLEGEADAILGVACLDSLEKSFERLSALGVPHQAFPLLCDGCAKTEAETDLLLAALPRRGGAASRLTVSYLPLLREASRLFSPSALPALLAPYLDWPPESPAERDPLATAEGLALDWLREGGKRLRPFVTLAACAVGRHGASALAPEADLARLLPLSVRRLAVAIEALHKASLVHDDIEDDDPFRYGEPTLHRRHGLPVALNAGDYLVGLGYRLVAGQAEDLGPACVSDLLQSLSAAHLRLCRGQGAELEWQSRGSLLAPADALALGALKTAPAFEVALYTGLRAAAAPVDPLWLRRFCAFLGQAYQLLNDLEDWEDPPGEHSTLGRDVAAARPTLLRALALQAGGGEALSTDNGDAPAALVERVRALYTELGVFAQARLLGEKLRARALELAGEPNSPDLRELMEFLVRVVLRRPVVPAP